jgi:hypothetical protein
MFLYKQLFLYGLFFYSLLQKSHFSSFKFIINVTDLINVLPGNNSINTVQSATIDEAIFLVVRAEQRWKKRVMQLVSKQQLGKHKQ